MEYFTFLTFLAVVIDTHSFKNAVTMRLVIIFLLLSLITSALSKQCGFSRYQDPIKRVFIRKKRLIVFPNYCSMKITVAVGKAVIATYPTGHNLSLELSVYYPLPTKLEEWYPRRYRERLKMATKKPMVPPKMPMSVKNSLKSRIDHDRIYYEGGASYIPGTHWTNRAPVLYSAPKYSADRVWINKDYSKFRKRVSILKFYGLTNCLK